MNLLEETIDYLKDNGKTPEDILFITCDTADNCQKIEFNWEEFCLFADDNYYSGYGAQEINGTLKIIGKDWWIERHEYDGSEEWDFKSLPKRLNVKKPPCKKDIFEEGFDKRHSESLGYYNYK